MENLGVNKGISLSLPHLQSTWPLLTFFRVPSLASSLVPFCSYSVWSSFSSHPPLLTLAVIHMLMTPKDIYQPIFDSSPSNFPNIKLAIRFHVSYSAHRSFPLGNFAQTAQSFLQGPLCCQSYLLILWFPIELCSLCLTGSSWGLDSVLFLFFIQPRTCTVPGYSWMLHNVCGKYDVISAVIDMCTKSSRNTEERELIFPIEQSWEQWEDGGLGKNLQGEGEKHCPLLRVLTKQPRKEIPVVICSC